MNKIVTSLLFIFSLLTSFSQDCFQASKTNWGNDSLECRKNVSLYSEFMKQKVFADAAIFWTKAQNYCPKYKPNLYANGAYIYKNIIKTKKKEKSSQVNLYFDSLYLVYDQWILNFGICDEIKADMAKDIITLSDRKKFNKAYELYREVFQNFTDLEALPSVGHKTASVVMAQAFNIPTFPVDTHIHRLVYRWGMSNGKNVKTTEKDAKRLFPENLWNKLHLQIIWYGRQYSPARGWNINNDPITKKIGRKSIVNKLI